MSRKLTYACAVGCFLVFLILPSGDYIDYDGDSWPVLGYERLLADAWWTPLALLTPLAPKVLLAYMPVIFLFAWAIFDKWYSVLVAMFPLAGGALVLITVVTRGGVFVGDGFWLMSFLLLAYSLSTRAPLMTPTEGTAH